MCSLKFYKNILYKSFNLKLYDYITLKPKNNFEIN